jgi:hypothetical protein
VGRKLPLRNVVVKQLVVLEILQLNIFQKKSFENQINENQLSHFFTTIQIFLILTMFYILSEEQLITTEKNKIFLNVKQMRSCTKTTIFEHIRDKTR